MKKHKKLIFLLSLALIVVLTTSQVVKEKQFSPAQFNTEKVKKVYTSMETGQRISKTTSLDVVGFEIQALSEKSDIGNSGDLLLTIKGAGFYLTSVSPKVVFTKDIILNNTEVNEKGTELYVVISKKMLKKLQSSRYKKATVIAGSMKGSEDAGTFLIKPESFVNFDSKKITILKYRNGFFVREGN